MEFIKRKPLDWVFEVFNYTFFILFTVVCILPFWYVFAYTLSDPQEAQLGITMVPRGLTLFNYIQILQLPGIYMAAFISVARTVSGTFLHVLACAFFAYLVTKHDMYFRKFIYRATIITMYLSAGLIPYYLWIGMLGLRNTFWVFIIPGMIGAFSIILIKTYIEQLPASLEESATIDGAGYVKVFFFIILPLSKPILATIALFAAVGHWNSFLDAFLFTTDTRLRPLQLLLWHMLNQAAATARMLTPEEMGIRAQQLTPVSLRMTITMVTIIPIIFVYPFAQRYFTRGLLIGAIKG